MAKFSLRNLSVLAYANGFTLWHYKATDGAYIQSPGFFNDAADLLTTGDMMIASGTTQAGVLFVGKDANIVTVSHVPLGGETPAFNPSSPATYAGA